MINFRAWSDIKADNVADAEHIAERIMGEIYAFTSVTDVVVVNVLPVRSGVDNPGETWEVRQFEPQDTVDGGW